MVFLADSGSPTAHGPTTLSELLPNKSICHVVNTGHACTCILLMMASTLSGEVFMAGWRSQVGKGMWRMLWLHCRAYVMSW